MGAGSILARPNSKSNLELTTALRQNITSHQPTTTSSYTTFTSASSDGQDLYIPLLDDPQGLAEERSAYDITVKLFYLPQVSANDRCKHTKDAVAFVLRELKVDYIDLLILSFPGITFDADDESDDSAGTSSSRETTVDDDLPEEMESILLTYSTLEKLHDSGVVKNLGLSEFGTQRLTRVLKEVRIPPTVDQINVRDCCVVPRPLIMFAKDKRIELLTHSDCTNVLPSGSLREVLSGCGVLAPSSTTTTEVDQANRLAGEVTPLWVVKYTAVVTNRGVVENKGYVAAASLS